MSLKWNILANSCGQIYATFLGIVMLPLYLKYLGAETYGLVGFFAGLQAWFQLLDMGMSPTVAREASRLNSSVGDSRAFRNLLHASEVIFAVLAAVTAIALISSSGWIAAHWLIVEKLPLSQVKHSIEMMAIIVGCRWIGGLYRGVIFGLERIAWISGFNVCVATIRFVLVIPLFIYWGTAPTDFFAFQLIVAFVETACLRFWALRFLPRRLRDPSHSSLPILWGQLRDPLKLSLTIALTGSIWTVVTQTDKLILSRILPLSEFAVFTLAAVVASGLLIVSGPISAALVPRMTKLHFDGSSDELLALYRDATQLLGIVVLPATLVMAFFAERLLWAWSGNAGMAGAAAPILTLYALGNGVLAYGAFPYYLQYAKGDLKLHVVGNVILALALVPLLIWATNRFGAIGAGSVWFGLNGAYFAFWTPLVHRRFSATLHSRWLVRDIAAVAAPPIVVVFASAHLLSFEGSRAAVLAQIALVSIAAVAAAALGSSRARTELASKVMRRA